LLLKELFESVFGSRLVFKGGTALRLVYGSARFSEDLDFTLTEEIDIGKFTLFLKEIKERYPTIVSIEPIDKFYTIFVLVRVREDYLSHTFSIKVEISKREGEWRKDKDYSVKVIRSEVSPLTVLAQVASLEKILQEKEDALKNRKAPRDVFDYWYINQLLKKEVKADFSRFNKEQAKAELHRLLARPYWRVVDSWLE
ncbi:MAG: nucleotidyl transferase AbiEii/AbiGii toxin family protein, partial [Patescibacteria group bacterium]